MLEEALSARNHRIAMLIDGDNAQPALAEKMLIEASKYGTVIVRRIYGDWTNTTLSGWKKVLPGHAIQPIQQFQYTTGKNSTDSALIIDAMDLLHQGVADCFCLVSSDSDYTRLATRIRESGAFVIGIGKKTTPQPFRAACDVFTYTENLYVDSMADKPVKQSKSVKAEDTAEMHAELDPLPLLAKAFEITVQENGWALLASLGSALRQLDPGFDPRTYGYSQLGKLLRAYPNLFEIDDTVTYVRLSEPTMT
jgi:hypothetical protein